MGEYTGEISKGIRIRRDGYNLGTMTVNDTMTLFRPVGQKEFELIMATGFKEFPPRLEWQPIFYSVLNEEYATFIAREWNTKDEASGFVGYVLKFSVRTDFVSQFPVQKVGSATALELWIPAERLAELNGNIVGQIEVISKHLPSTSH
jgi:hypothetical protein